MQGPSLQPAVVHGDLQTLGLPDAGVQVCTLVPPVIDEAWLLIIFLANLICSCNKQGFNVGVGGMCSMENEHNVLVAGLKT